MNVYGPEQPSGGWTRAPEGSGSVIRASSAAARNASAYRSARSVIGLYGDQAVSWSILLEADLTSALDPQLAGKRLDDLVARHPHLGSAPQLLRLSPDDWAPTRAAFADRPYSPDEPLVRVAVQGARVLVAAHHGAADGIGLLALLGAVLDQPVRSSARGVLDRAPNPSFLRSAARRLSEAVFTPPSRVAADRGDAANDAFATPDVLNASFAATPDGRLDTATLVSAGARAVAGYNAARGASARRLVAAVGASKDGGNSPNPWHSSTFLRLPVDPDATVDEVREQLRVQPPEPDFPVAGGGVTSSLASRFARLLAPRLGSTYLASNLGLISADAVTAVRFFPAASGPNGVSFGLASTPSGGSFTVRARGASCSPAGAQELLNRLVEAAQRG